MPNKNACTVYTVHVTVWILAEKKNAWPNNSRCNFQTAIKVNNHNCNTQWYNKGFLTPQQLNIHNAFHLYKTTNICTPMFVKYNCTTQQVPRDVYIWIQARLCYLIMIKKKKKTQHKIMNFSSWLLPHPNRRFILTGTEGTLLVDILLRYQWTHGEWFHTHTPANTMMQNYVMETWRKGRKTRGFTAMDEHFEVHGFLNTVRFHGVHVYMKRSRSLGPRVEFRPDKGLYRSS